jgi:8-oxo-dGTP pyrophosphatase MutT (NUDIX family)
MLFNDLENARSEEVVLMSVKSIVSIPVTSLPEMKLVQNLMQLIRFVMVSRRDTYGMIEFVKGNYDETDQESVKNLFRQMLAHEITRIGQASCLRDITHHADVVYPLLDVTNRLWDLANAKFERLKSGVGVPYDLQHYLKIVPEIHTPEITLPGGHRIDDEIPIVAAKREFCEETALTDDKITILTPIKPQRENLLGTDNKWYRRFYYPAYMTRAVPLRVDPNNPGQRHEIGEVFYCSYESAMMLIRPEHEERRSIINTLFCFVVTRILILERYKRAHLNTLMDRQLLHPPEVNDDVGRDDGDDNKNISHLEHKHGTAEPVSEIQQRNRSTPSDVPKRGRRHAQITVATK